ncbi:MAG: DMP19 family protein [Thiomicrorhabdus sp.]|nr:DMP19 family protein [Thiomicrorhabdus sp.]
MPENYDEKCGDCDIAIHMLTARATSGLCMSCQRKRREQGDTAPWISPRSKLSEEDILNFSNTELGYRAASCVDAVEPDFLPPPWRAVLTTSWLETQVNNGGFDQFFDDSYQGRLNEITKDDLTVIGATPLLEIYVSALNVATDKSISITEIEEQLEQYGRKFYDQMGVSGESLPEYLGAYIKTNPSEFTKTYAQFLDDLESQYKA